MEEISVYLVPITKPCAFYPFYGSVSTISDEDTFDEYLTRFEDAWKEMGENA